MQIINRKGYADHPYIAGFKGQEIGIYAESLSAAMQRAVEHFRPNKKDRGLVWVELADEE